jgi:hypothetical protein
MVRYVLLRPLRPELVFYGRRTLEITTIVLLYVLLVNITVLSADHCLPESIQVLIALDFSIHLSELAKVEQLW